MKFELIEVNTVSNSSECFPDFFDDCNPTADDCMPNDIADYSKVKNSATKL